MTREGFIKSLIALFGVAVLPKNIVRQYQKIYLLQSFIRGFRFYAGPGLLAEMHEGDMLELVRELNNPHDSCAIALHFNNHKIGYIPREENEMLSRLLDAGVIELMAEITHLEPAAAAWENVHIAVYVLKDMYEGVALPEPAAYLTLLDTPRYRTLKYKNDRIARVYYGQGEETEENMLPDQPYDKKIFYDLLAKRHKMDGVGIPSPADLEKAASQMRLVVNQNHLPPGFQMDEIVRKLDDSILSLDAFFDEKGYAVANMNRLAELPSRISRFVEVSDKEGRRFFEIMLKA